MLFSLWLNQLFTENRSKKKVDLTKKAFFVLKKAFSLSVVWAGIEPATHGFSVHCSTD